MTPSSTVEGFKGKYEFLSNFHIEPDGSCVEIEYQASKTHDQKIVGQIMIMTPREAKKAGKKIPLRPDWEEVKLSVMSIFVHAKFYDHPTLAKKLVATGDLVLVEINWWGDTYWGECRGEGQNWLGKILMNVRTGLVRDGY